MSDYLLLMLRVNKKVLVTISKI